MDVRVGVEKEIFRSDIVWWSSSFMVHINDFGQISTLCMFNHGVFVSHCVLREHDRTVVERCISEYIDVYTYIYSVRIYVCKFYVHVQCMYSMLNLIIKIYERKINHLDSLEYL